MAKVSKAKVEKRIDAQFGEIFWDKARNERDEAYYGDKAVNDELRSSLKQRQWFPHHSISVCGIDDSGIEKCLSVRQKFYDELIKDEALQKETDKDYISPQVAVFKQLYMDGKGKLISPKFYGNSGFRRSQVFFDAMVDRYLEGLEFHGNIPIIVKVYQDEVDRIIDQQLENELQDIGVCEVPALNKLRIVKKLFDLGTREVRIRELYKTTMAQKLYGICQANSNWPNLNIYDRFFLPSDHEDHIPVSRVLHTTIIQLNNRYEADQKRKQGIPLKDHELKLLPISESEAAQYFINLKLKSDSRPPKSMARPDVEAKAKHNAIDLLKSAYQSVLDNSDAPILPFMNHAETINKVTNMIQNGKASTLRDAIFVVESGGDLLMSKLSRLLNKGTSVENIVEVLDSLK